MFGLQDQYPDKTERAAVALEWVRRIGLEEFSNYYPKQLSGGMQLFGSLVLIIIFLELDPLFKTKAFGF